MSKSLVCDVNAIHLPSGDQSGSVGFGAPAVRDHLNLPAAAGIFASTPAFGDFRRETNPLPSGDQHGEESSIAGRQPLQIRAVGVANPDVRAAVRSKSSPLSSRPARPPRSCSSRKSGDHARAGRSKGCGKKCPGCRAYRTCNTAPAVPAPTPARPLSRCRASRPARCGRRNRKRKSRRCRRGRCALNTIFVWPMPFLPVTASTMSSANACACRRKLAPV